MMYATLSLPVLCLLVLVLYVEGSAPNMNMPSPSSKTFVSYNVYKGKAALCIKPVSPTFTAMAGGNRVLSRDGGLLIEAAPLTGTREYDWSKKSAFLLDPSELGQILHFHESKGNELNFLHDTFMGDPEKAGQVQKRFKITTTPDGKGFFFNLQVNSKLESIKNSALSVPVSYPEFYVIKNLIEFILPRVLGFDQMTSNNVILSSTSGNGLWEPSGPPPPPPPAYRVIE